MGESDFMKRLQAMREGKSAEQRPSLKDRLNQTGTPQRSASPTSDAGASRTADEIRARIQAKFKKQAEPQSADQAAPDFSQDLAEPVVAPETSETSDIEPVPTFKMRHIPQAQQTEEEEKTQQWTPENGGVCPNCDVFNPGHVAFCGSCEYMLLRSEQEVEIITSYPLSELKGLVITFVQKLDKLNIRTTEDVLRVASRRSNRPTLAKHTGMSERSLLRLVHQADFCRIPSLGPENAAMLELIGITDMPKLLSFSPLEIYKKIQQAKIKLNQQGIMFLPTKTQVKTWFDEAVAIPALKIDP